MAVAQTGPLFSKHGKHKQCFYILVQDQQGQNSLILCMNPVAK